ncbi:MAG: S-layer homology domain-containing protein [Candidatus Nomurabacteria bacterium]|nr:S-layer homology domain-containing protein [Candidatus Nomurabacteria bacterium]
MFKLKKGKGVARGLLAGILAAVLVITGAGTAFAAEVPQIGTPEYYVFIDESPNYQMEYVAGGRDTPEYRALVERWVEAMLPNMEDMSWYTYLPRQNEDMVWKAFHSGNPNWSIMRDELYRLANELDITNSDLSTEEKVARIDTWAAGDGYRGKVIGSIDEVSASERPWVVTEGGKTYLAGPFVNHARTIDGKTYDCDQRAVGLEWLYRLAGVPAVFLALSARALPVGHMETMYYLNNQWWVSAGRNYTDGNAMLLTDYVATSDVTTGYTLEDCSFPIAEIRVMEELVSIDKTTGEQSNYNFIKDVNESWIRPTGEENFMFKLLQSPYAHPEKSLMRGEVAKLLCDYIHIVPMRNEQVFSDVPTTHQYAPYIWVMSRLGLMTGDDNGNFNPDSGLSMQEFAVIANRVVEYVRQLVKGVDKSRWGGTSPGKIGIILSKLEAPSGQSKTFADAKQIASWAKPAIDEFSKYGILVGDGNGYLKPTETLSRLRFLVFLSKMDDRFEAIGGEGVFNGVIATPRPLF